MVVVVEVVVVEVVVVVVAGGVVQSVVVVATVVVVLVEVVFVVVLDNLELVGLVFVDMLILIFFFRLISLLAIRFCVIFKTLWFSLSCRRVENYYGKLSFEFDKSFLLSDTVDRTTHYCTSSY